MECGIFFRFERSDDGEGDKEKCQHTPSPPRIPRVPHPHIRSAGRVDRARTVAHLETEEKGQEAGELRWEKKEVASLKNRRWRRSNDKAGVRESFIFPFSRNFKEAKAQNNQLSLLFHLPPAPPRSRVSPSHPDSPWPRSA